MPEGINMASFTQTGCAKNLTEDEPFGSNESSASIKIPQLPEKEYDFVEEPSQDYICPVTLELLRDPQQTTCCGHHLSLEAATGYSKVGNHALCATSLILHPCQISSTNER